MKSFFKLQAYVLLSLWVVAALHAGFHAWKAKDSVRLDFWVLPSGFVSSLQREEWLRQTQGLLPRDQITHVSGLPFHMQSLGDWLNTQKLNQKIQLTVRRNNQTFTVNSYLQRYSKNDFVILFGLPLFVSIIFLAFAVGVSLVRQDRLRSSQATQIFSLLCFLVSLFFLSFLEVLSFTQGLAFTLLPLFISALSMHLFWVYPKEKARPWVRRILFSATYLGALLLAGLDFFRSETMAFHWLSPIFCGLCLLVGLGSLVNTLLTSRDFWARRRARLISFAMVGSFVLAVVVFWTSMMEVPRISLERLLAVSLIFPAAFSGIFLKENVFNLERLFRRGVHQLLLLAVASSFAVLVGIGWSQWVPLSSQEWWLWVAIAIGVILVARPASQLFEDRIHKLIQTRVRYPDVSDLFENSKSLGDFLKSFCAHCEENLNMRSIRLSFFQDPTQAWSLANSQSWDFKDSMMIRSYDLKEDVQYRNLLLRGDESIGEICFEGGDSLAFDPFSSREWTEVVRTLSRCIEILSMREFVAVQQSFLAVGRMQSLIAHQMKNPLAIIKVCAGLLANHMKGNEEGEELLRTIQDEVARVASAVQSVFEHSSQRSAPERVHLGAVLSQIKENVLARFPNREIEVSYWIDEKRDEAMSVFGIWIEKEGFRQALTNLVVNAFEAGSSWVGLEVRLNKKEFSVVVRDRGPGVSEKLDLFKPFVTTKPHGTGLGLSHVKSFVDRNKGQIRVESRKGEGSSFTLEFSRDFVLNKASDGESNQI